VFASQCVRWSLAHFQQNSHSWGPTDSCHQRSFANTMTIWRILALPGATGAAPKLPRRRQPAQLSHTGACGSRGWSGTKQSPAHEPYDATQRFPSGVRTKCDRTEDGALMAFVEIGLILVCVCVLLIKSCDASNLTTALHDADDYAQRVCRGYGFGDTADGDCLNSHCRLGSRSPKILRCALIYLLICDAFTGLYVFFICFGLFMLFLLLIIGTLKLYITGQVPRIVLMLSLHSVSPSTVLRRVLVRKCGAKYNLNTSISVASLRCGQLGTCALHARCLHVVMYT
jgi:hypothetical protein